MIYLVNMCRYTHVLKADWTGEGEGVWSVGHVVHMVIKIKIKIKKNRAQLLYVCQLCVCMYGEEVLDSSTYIRFSNPPGDEKTPVQRAPKVSKTPGPAGPKKKKKNWGCVRPFSSETCCFRRKSCFESLFLCL